MQLKKGISLAGLRAEIIPAMIIVNDYFKNLNKPFVITSGSEGVHMQGSKHYIGEAFDLRTFELTPAELDDLVNDLNVLLSNNYDIVRESDHVHIEWDEHSG